MTLATVGYNVGYNTAEDAIKEWMPEYANIILDREIYGGNTRLIIGVETTGGGSINEYTLLRIFMCDDRWHCSVDINTTRIDRLLTRLADMIED